MRRLILSQGSTLPSRIEHMPLQSIYQQERVQKAQWFIVDGLDSICQVEDGKGSLGTDEVTSNHVVVFHE